MQTSLTPTNVSMAMRGMLLVVVALLVAACNPPQTPTKVTGLDTKAVPETGGPGSTPEGGADPSKPHGLGKTEVPKITFSKDTFEVKKPGSGDWRKASKPASEIMDAVDRAMSEPVPMIALADTNFDVGGATLAGKSTVKIKDAKTYAVEYYTPESRATLNRIISDGAHKSSFSEEKWTPPAPPQKPDRSPVDDPTLKAWPQAFMRSMFAAYDSGHTVWGPLVRYWQRNGFTVTVEERTANMKDNRRFFRIVGTGKDGSQTEIHVDGMRNLPILVRTVTKTADGQSDKRMWSAAWQFGGTFEAKEFRVPGVAASVAERPGP
ncbi:MAG: hypothetical protein JST30_02510 [Armatimonadetes bacterium]|nr:hypothetical protein [Armatimonadota bacterium]